MSSSVSVRTPEGTTRQYRANAPSILLSNLLLKDKVATIVGTVLNGSTSEPAQQADQDSMTPASANGQFADITLLLVKNIVGGKPIYETHRIKDCTITVNGANGKPDLTNNLLLNVANNYEMADGTSGFTLYGAVWETRFNNTR